MLARRVAQAWLHAAVTRASCSSSSTSSSSLLQLEPYTALRCGLQQLRSSLFHTTTSHLASQSDGSSSSSSTAPSSDAAGNSSTSTRAAGAAEVSQPQQSEQHTTAQAAAARFVTVPNRLTDTGYPQTFVQSEAQQQQQQQQQQQDAEAASSSGAASSSSSSSSSEQQQGRRLGGGFELPPEVLRVALTQEVKQEQAEVAVDAYSLSRSLVSEASPGAPKAFGAAAAAVPEQQQQQQAGREPLTAADKEALEKLVGVLTKDGKKSRARLLLDAMHIIQQQLAQGKGSSA